MSWLAPVDSRHRAAAWLALVAACVGFQFVATGCAGGVGEAELVQPPIAVIYWSQEAARAQREEREGGADRPLRLGVARAGDIGRLLGAPDDSEPQDWRVRYPGHIGLVDPVSGAVSRLEVARAGSVPLDWSADHTKLLYASKADSGYWQLFVYDVESGEAIAVTHGDHHHARGALGPAGELAFTRFTSDGRRLVMVQRSPAEAPRVLLSGVYVEKVSWSPEGDMLLLAVEEPSRKKRGGEPRRTLFAISPNATQQAWPPEDGSALRSLGRGQDPAYGAAAEWFVYSAPVGRGWRLRRMRTDDGARMDLGTGTRAEVEPALSPDGTLVVYVALEAGFHRLFVRRIDGTGERMLVTDRVAVSPVW